MREVDLLRSAVVATLIARPLQVDAWIVLPDHMHFVWTLPEGDSDYSVRIAAIKARFTRNLRQVGWNPTLPTPSKRRKGEAGVWQRRFCEHHIRDEPDFAAHVRYCWGNPVKHGLVRHPADWPYSSIHRDISKGLVDPEWTGAMPEGAYGEQGGVSPRHTRRSIGIEPTRPSDTVTARTSCASSA
uniref:REP-associated tyrosine transposase n=1 Tax=Primorskyibacter flagellatus TaxID=1387277 RepID=UPI001E59577E|nr:transposase [Primorskyibacter flagellatus]